MHPAHWIICGLIYLLFIYLFSHSQIESLSLHAERISRYERIYDKTFIQEIRCTKQPHMKIHHEQRLLGLPLFTEPLHGILPKHGLSLRWIYIYAIGTLSKGKGHDNCSHINITPPSAPKFPSRFPVSDMILPTTSSKIPT